MNYRLELTDVADDRIRKQIAAPLLRYNESKAGPDNFRPLIVVFGELPDYPPGFSRVFLTKRLGNARNSIS